MNVKDLRVKGDRLRSSLEEMAEIGATPGGGVQRLTLTNEDKKARDLFVKWLDACRLDIRIDEMGNIFGRRPGKERTKRIAGLVRTIKAEKARRRIRPDPEADPNDTGMVGLTLSPVTSNTGYLSAKHTAINPNFAAVFVQLLKRAGVNKGDLVAAGLSGSFPSLNIAAFSAMQTLELEPIVIASASASQWGANHVDFLWIDMERVLFEQKIFRFRSMSRRSRGRSHTLSTVYPFHGG